MKVLLLFSNGARLTELLDQDDFESLFNLKISDFDDQSCYFFNGKCFAALSNGERIKEDSILVFGDNISLIDFKKTIDRIGLTLDKKNSVAIVHQKPFVNEDGGAFKVFLENSCLTVLQRRHEKPQKGKNPEDFYIIYTQLSKINKSKKSSQELVQALIDSYFKSGMEEQILNDKFELLHQLLAPEGINNNEAKVESYIATSRLKFNLKELKKLDFMNERYQKFLVTLRNHLLDNAG